MAALCLSAASAAPQFLRAFHPAASPAAVHTLHAAPAAATVVRTAAAAPITHVTTPVVRVAAAPQPVVHAVAHPVEHTVVRTVPAVTHEVVEEAETIESDASYSFGYSIADQASGDSKTRQVVHQKMI